MKTFVLGLKKTNRLTGEHGKSVKVTGGAESLKKKQALCTGSLYSNLSHCKFLNLKKWSNSFLTQMEAGKADFIKKKSSIWWMERGAEGGNVEEKTEKTQR